MKNRKLLFVLVPAVLFVWGAIAYTVIVQMKGPESESELTVLPELNTQSDTLTGYYNLLANYRDPFLSSVSVEDKEEKFDRSRLNRPLIEVPAIPRQIQWPMVEYGGLISNNEKWLALIRMNGTNYLMNEGDIQQQLLLISAYKDSIQVEYQREKKIILKKL